MGSVAREVIQLMAFYVNEDKPDNLATVHQNQGPCHVPQPKQAKDGRWHGPFDSKDESLRVARETHRPVKECGRCKL